MAGTITIRLEDETDRWRWVCPVGHRQWEPTNHHFWCASCARSWGEGVEPEFDELRDLATGRLVHRDEIRLLTSVGPYDDVVREGSA
ncbi:hypothetical protein [Halomarina pelagica]|uniref:hypothetical protein n=1 Tax=Halomarina pelagica TaxID=2961599 RepID=UPI0020C42244|nr:hypothetical protein [Halomarina sp. BND7]